MDSAELRRRLADDSVAVLATVTPEGRPHAVPICYALDGHSIYFAVDHKPKRSTDLKRLHNIAATPSVVVLVQHYEHDWDRLWWVRVDGTARIVEDAGQRSHAIDLLIDRYTQYRKRPPDGPVVAITIDRLSGWSST
jgi:PPOX class probable F420-dependent enzyme